MEGVCLFVVTTFTATLVGICRGWQQILMAVRALSELLGPKCAP